MKGLGKELGNTVSTFAFRMHLIHYTKFSFHNIILFSQVVDVERDIKVAKSGKENLHYKILLDLNADFSLPESGAAPEGSDGTKDLKIKNEPKCSGLTNVKRENAKVKIVIPDDESDEDSQDDTDSEESDNSSDSEQESKFRNSSRPKNETTEERKV